jgi:phosphoenolpyruvate carboxykinase (ATP)
MDWEGFIPDMNDEAYVAQLKARMTDRLNEIEEFSVVKDGYDKLPEDALAAIQKVVDELK